MKKLKTLGLLVPILVCGFGVSEATKVSFDSAPIESVSNSVNSYVDQVIEPDFTYTQRTDDYIAYDFSVTINNVVEPWENLYIVVDNGSNPQTTDLGPVVISGTKDYYYRFDRYFYDGYDVHFSYNGVDTNTKRIVTTGIAPTIKNVEIDVTLDEAIVTFDYAQNDAFHNLFQWRTFDSDGNAINAWTTFNATDEGIIIDVSDYEWESEYSLQLRVNPIQGSDFGFQQVSYDFETIVPVPTINNVRMVEINSYTAKIEVQFDLDKSEQNDLFIKRSRVAKEGTPPQDSDYPSIDDIIVVPNSELLAASNSTIVVEDYNLFPNTEYDLTIWFDDFHSVNPGVEVEESFKTKSIFNPDDENALLNIEVEIINQHNASYDKVEVHVTPAPNREQDLKFLDEMVFNIEYNDSSKQNVRIDNPFKMVPLGDISEYATTFAFDLDQKYSDISWIRTTGEVIDNVGSSFFITPTVEYLIPYVFPWTILVISLAAIILLIIIGYLVWIKRKYSTLTISEMELMTLQQLHEYSAKKRYKNVSFKEPKTSLIYRLAKNGLLSGRFIKDLQLLELSELKELILANELKPPEQIIAIKNLLIIWIVQFYEDNKVSMSLKKLRNEKGIIGDGKKKKLLSSYTYIHKSGLVEQKKLFETIVGYGVGFDKNNAEENKYVLALNATGKLRANAHKILEIDEEYLRVIASRAYGMSGVKKMSLNQLKWKILLYCKIRELSIEPLTLIISKEDLESYITKIIKENVEKNVDSKILVAAKAKAKAKELAEIRMSTQHS